MEVPEIVIRPRRGFDREEWLEHWRRRELLWLLAWREIRVRYAQTALGALWAVAQPAGLSLLFSLVLGPRAPRGDESLPYPVVVYAGFLPWMLFASIVNHAANSVVGAERLVTKVYLPRLLIPFSTLGAATLDLCVAAVPLLACLLWYGHRPGPSWLCVAPCLVCVALLALGVGAFLAALNVLYRDVRHALPFVMQAWMLATPSIFLDVRGDSAGGPMSWIPALNYINPVCPLVAAVRSCVLNQELTAGPLAVGCAASCVLFLLGVAFFRRAEARFADCI